MKSKRIREEEIKTVLGKRNYVILIIGSILIIIGYILMSGEGSTILVLHSADRYLAGKHS